MKRLWIVLTILALLAVMGCPTIASNNNLEPFGAGPLRAKPGTRNLEHLSGENVWTQSSQGMWGGDVKALAISPGYVTDRTLFAGTSGGVFKSSDGGASWSAMNIGLTSLDVRALALLPCYASDRTLFAGTSGGVFKSTDGGASWSAITNWGAWALALSPGYASDHTLFAGIWGRGVRKSSDGGASWSAVNTGITNLNINALALSPDYASDSTLFAGTWGGVFKSSDGGASWNAMNTGLIDLGVYALALSPGYATDSTLSSPEPGGRSSSPPTVGPLGLWTWVALPQAPGLWPFRRAIPLTTPSSLGPMATGASSPLTAGPPGAP